MKDESLEEPLVRVGKARDKDDFESGDLPYSESQVFRGEVSEQLCCWLRRTESCILAV